MCRPFKINETTLQYLFPIFLSRIFMSRIFSRPQVLSPAPSVGQLVCVAGGLWKNGQLDLDGVWGGEFVKSKDEASRWGCQSLHKERQFGSGYEAPHCNQWVLCGVCSCAKVHDHAAVWGSEWGRPRHWWLDGGLHAPRRRGGFGGLSGPLISMDFCSASARETFSTRGWKVYNISIWTIYQRNCY